MNWKIDGHRESTNSGPAWWKAQEQICNGCQLRVCWCRAPSHARGRVCCLQFLTLGSALILESESHRIHDHILLSPILDFPNWRARSLHWHPPVSGRPNCTPTTGLPFRRLYYSHDYGGGNRNRLHSGCVPTNNAIACPNLSMYMQKTKTKASGSSYIVAFVYSLPRKTRLLSRFLATAACS
jgi:hypothetical protein